MVAILIKEETYDEGTEQKILTSPSKETAEKRLRDLGYTFRGDYNAWVMRIYHSTYYATIFTDIKELV